MEVCITGGLLTKFTTTDAQRPIPMFSYSCRIEFLPAYGQNWIQHPNGVAITHNLNPNFMGLLFYSMFPKVRNHGFAKTFLLGRFIIQNALLVNSTKWWLHFHKFNYWERYYQPDINIVCTLETRFSSSLLILLDYGSLFIFPKIYLFLLVRHIHRLKESCERLWVSLLPW